MSRMWGWRRLRTEEIPCKRGGSERGRDMAIGRKIHAPVWKNFKYSV